MATVERASRSGRLILGNEVHRLMRFGQPVRLLLWRGARNRCRGWELYFDLREEILILAAACSTVDVRQPSSSRAGITTERNCNGALPIGTLLIPSLKFRAVQDWLRRLARNVLKEPKVKLTEEFATTIEHFHAGRSELSRATNWDFQLRLTSWFYKGINS